MDIMSGSLLKIVSHFHCGGCGGYFQVEMEVGGIIPPGWTMFDVAVDSIRGGFEGGSIQGGYILCKKCTQDVDDAVQEDRNATQEEVYRVFSDEEA